MSNLAVPAIQAAARGGTRALTQLAVTTATNALMRSLDNRVFEGPRLESFHLQTSRDGAPMPRVFGRTRLAGQVIWASRVRESVTEESVGGKGGGPVQRDYRYTISFAVGLCEGEILGVDRVWANGDILQRSGLTVRVHTGSDTQVPDPVIAATEPGAVPAFRGTAYIVFEDFPLDDYGTRLPSINAEIVRGVRRGGRMEDLIQSVNLLPGTGEFALSPTVVEETPEVGVSVASNMNSFTGQADLLTSLDQLQAELPNCRHVNIISAWFGTSIDAGECEVHPGAERLDRRLPDVTWRVAGVERGSAYIVSATDEGRANYGGTPSDDGLIACIRELKQRGFAVTLYPFLLMDSPGFPWRGRITAESPADVAAFFGTDEDFRFRHSILHHARLAEEAGGVDAIVIGTELKALMAYRSGETFPAVNQMRSLAAATRAIVGSGTTITYAADWSDYFGVHSANDQGSDVRYHLDPLWADDNIDVVGIDCYFPLSDWRDGDHLDAAPGRTGHDGDYLRGNVEGGEGYDWYYASAGDRDAQIRSPIDDPVFRNKDLRHWWKHTHIERRNGVAIGQSPWQPQSKPIWLLEIGCPAVNKGANQPNVFYDPKSVDSALPYSSDGTRDDLTQRRYLEALLSYYSETNEPGFLDLSRASVWAWDARPYPDFPARLSVWSDGTNWSRGHWLNGRTGLMPVADIVDELSRDSGLTQIDVSGISGVLPGYVVDRPMSARAALQPLLQLFDIELQERAGQVIFSVGGAQSEALSAPLSAEDFVQGPVTRTRADPEGRIRDVRLTYIDAARDYQLASASARDLDSESVAVVDMAIAASLDEGFARFVARRELDAAHSGTEQLRLELPLRLGLCVDVGDRFTHDRQSWVVGSLETGSTVAVTARSARPNGTPWFEGVTPVVSADTTWSGAPQLLAFDLPDRSGVSVGVLLNPFEPVSARFGEVEASLDAPLRLGATLTDLFRRTPVRIDRVSRIDVFIPGLLINALEDEVFLAGGNRFAVETSKGWEIIAVRDVELIASNRYRLSHLLRGLDGSDAMMADIVQSGARLLWLGSGVETLSLSDDWRGTEIEIEGSSAMREARTAEIVWNDTAGRPLSPVHPRWDGNVLSWIGRDRDFFEWTVDAEHLRYAVSVYRGGTVERIETVETYMALNAFDRAEVRQIGLDSRESLEAATLIVP